MIEPQPHFLVPFFKPHYNVDTLHWLVEHVGVDGWSSKVVNVWQNVYGALRFDDDAEAMVFKLSFPEVRPYAPHADQVKPCFFLVASEFRIFKQPFHIDYWPEWDNYFKGL